MRDKTSNKEGKKEMARVEDLPRQEVEIKIGEEWRKFWVAKSGNNSYWVWESRRRMSCPFFVTLAGPAQEGGFPFVRSCLCQDGFRFGKECVHIQAAQRLCDKREES